MQRCQLFWCQKSRCKFLCEENLFEDESDVHLFSDFNEGLVVLFHFFPVGFKAKHTDEKVNKVKEIIEKVEAISVK
jgi:hypothetical protein